MATVYHLAAAGVLIVNTDGQVLMVQNPYREGLVLPGGMVEDNEAPAAAAEREVLEETGLRLQARRLLVVHHKGPQPGKPSNLQFVFGTDPIATDTVLTPQPGEVTALRWLSPDQAIQRHVPAGQTRLTLAFEARTRGQTFYLDAHRQLPVADQPLTPLRRDGRDQHR